MDDTELHYLTYDPNEIIVDMMQAYVDAGGTVIRAGDEKEMLLRGVQNTFVLAFAGIDNALRMATLRYAVGDYLDVLGENRNCPRNEATKAKAGITITTRNTGETELIAAGSVITQDGVVLYVTDEDITLPGTAGTVTATITADQAGARGNGLLSGSTLMFIANFDGVDGVTCTTSASGGQDREEDDAYRERIRNYGLSAITTGPAEQYRSAAMAVSSEILDAAPVNGGDGVVNIYLLPAHETGTQALIDAVEEALSAEDVRPLTDDVNVALATKLTYTLNVEYTADSSTNISAALAEAVEEYQIWQDQTIGRAFNPDKLLALLYNAGCSRVVFGAGSEFDGGSAEYTEIDPNEYCKGTITLTAVSA